MLPGLVHLKETFPPYALLVSLYCQFVYVSIFSFILWGNYVYIPHADLLSRTTMQISISNTNIANVKSKMTPNKKKD